MIGKKNICWLFFPFLFYHQKEPDKKSIDVYYWAAKYNDSTLFDSNKDGNKKWAYSLYLRSIKRIDSITLLLQPDCCHKLNPAIIIKDSTSETLVRYYPGTDKIAVKDILTYISKENNKVWLLYTEKDPEKDGTVMWDLEKTYPKSHGYPRLFLTISE